MPKAESSSSVDVRQPRSSRSVAGCLTCRRRKVKCTSGASPCEPCRRLKLPCDPSFHQNFKTWASKSTKNGHQGCDEARQSPRTENSTDDQSQSRGMRVPPAATILRHQPSANAECCRNEPPEEDATIRDTDADKNPTDDTSSLLDFIFSDLADEMTSVDFATPANLDAFCTTDWVVQRPLASDSYESYVYGSGNDVLVHNDTTSTPVSSSRAPAEQATSRAVSQGPLEPTTSQVMSRVPEFLSTKQSIYTCFHYLVSSARAIPNSPLCHAILGWVYAYLERLSPGSASSRDGHYTAASEAIRALVTELMTPLVPEMWRRTSASEQLSSFLSATFFACQHDLMMESFYSFITRVNETKMVFQRHWAERTLPGPVESRILIWLAFLELRFFFLGGEKFARADHQQDLMSLLDETNALPTLRRARTQKSVLSEMFPDNLPREEDEEDLRKDRCRVQFDDFMCYFAKIRRFVLWDMSQAQGRDVDSLLLKELREAKIEALHAHLRRLQVECQLAIPSNQVLPSSDQTIDSITFHMLTVRALQSCAVILFKRATDESSRTDGECQSAVADIVRVARALRQTKYLRSPRSTIWPLPLYIAGIETTDGVYQDWILDYMKELGSWGAHIQVATEALQRSISLQEKTGFRVSLVQEITNT